MEAGTKLGHYEILDRLGAGGMGDVYRARDMTLDRDVAIKVLPEDFAEDAERLARFEREAKVLASLNHTNSDMGATSPDRWQLMQLSASRGPTSRVHVGTLVSSAPDWPLARPRVATPNVTTNVASVPTRAFRMVFFLCLMARRTSLQTAVWTQPSSSSGGTSSIVSISIFSPLQVPDTRTSWPA